jgi:hypothetical protein
LLVWWKEAGKEVWILISKSVILIFIADVVRSVLSLSSALSGLRQKEAFTAELQLLKAD